MTGPGALAVFRLIFRRNLVGCSTGKSAGLAPLNILSMKYAGSSDQRADVGSITHETAESDEVVALINRWNAGGCCESNDLRTSCRIEKNQQRIALRLGDFCERLIEIGFLVRGCRHQLQTNHCQPQLRPSDIALDAWYWLTSKPPRALPRETARAATRWLGAIVTRHIGQAGDVASWFRQAHDKTGYQPGRWPEP